MRSRVVRALSSMPATVGFAFGFGWLAGMASIWAADDFSWVWAWSFVFIFLSLAILILRAAVGPADE